MATLLLSLRSRPELIMVMEEAPDLVAPPTVALDQLFSSFVLLSGESDHGLDLDLSRDDEDLAAWMRAEDVTRFIDSVANAR